MKYNQIFLRHFGYISFDIKISGTKSTAYFVNYFLPLIRHKDGKIDKTKKNKMIHLGFISYLTIFVI